MKAEFNHLADMTDREIAFLTCEQFWREHNPLVLRKKKGHSREARVWIGDLESFYAPLRDTDVAKA